MKDDIEKALHVLIGEPLLRIGRAGNMLWMAIGKEIEESRRDGSLIKTGEFSLNISCNWRFYQNNSIELASMDFYYPGSTIKDAENFDWDEIGSTRFDELASQFSAQRDSGYIIKSIVADNLGGFKMVFDNDMIVEIFPDESIKENEVWRFIKRIPDVHIVVSGAGIEES